MGHHVILSGGSTAFAHGKLTRYGGHFCDRGMQPIKRNWVGVNLHIQAGRWRAWAG
jgi:hypothetical protein